MRSLIIAVAALAATGGPAMSEIKPQNAWLTLQTPTTQDHIVFDGAVWRCKADICRSPQVKAMPPMRSCRRLVRELGPISSFGFRGVTFSEADLAACNGVLVAGR
ncbi:CC_3452 family protein [Caulobacter sp. DWR2-3-1b2]|uniref:CC_3452 family protein n=1 Tax=unclassified Caulobacter TaxID=2648921 RepID=UPI003CF4519B